MFLGIGAMIRKSPPIDAARRPPSMSIYLPNLLLMILDPSKSQEARSTGVSSTLRVFGIASTSAPDVTAELSRSTASHVERLRSDQ